MCGLPDNLTTLPKTMADCGVDPTWDPDDLKEVICHHAERWAEEKESLGVASNDPLERIPGFLESVQRLLDQGYTYKDIGAFFGVSYEAVRLWCDKYGLERMDQRQTKARVWSWEKEMFVPVTNEEYIERARRAFITRQRKMWQQKKDEVSGAIRRLRQELGRPPSLLEVQEKVGVHRHQIAHWWGYVPNYDVGRSYAEAWDAMYADAGVRRLKNTTTREDGRWWGF